MKKKPNIILIMTDQQRFDTISAYGSREVTTPNIDRIAKQGVLFNKAYAECPECVPARHALISGQHPLRTGVISNIVGRLSPTTPTIMSVLSNNGYYCQAIGKMHFIPPRETFGFHNMLLSEEVPSSIKIDDYFSYLNSEGYLDYIREPHGMRGHMYYIPQISALPKEKHTTWWTAEKSIEFLNNIKKKQQPFFLFTSFIKPHPPFDPPYPYNYMFLPNQLKSPLKGPEDNINNWNLMQLIQNYYKCNITDPYFLKTMRAFYYASIKFVDDMIGEILDTLERNEQIENTIIIFTSDHGEFLGDHGCFGKRSWYEAPGRIPLIVSYPQKLPLATHSSELAGHLDIMPTIFSLADIKYNGIMDGIDLSKSILENKKYRHYLFGILDFDTGGSIHCVITDGYKYTYSSAEGMESLINIDKDSCEFYNLANSENHLDIKNDLIKSIFTHYKRLNVSDKYFVGEKWKNLNLEKRKYFESLFRNQDNSDNTGRYLHFSNWDGRTKAITSNIKTKFNLFS